MSRFVPPTLPFDLSSPEFWAQGPDAKLNAFMYLRRAVPVSFWAESDWLVPDVARRGNGYWAITKYDDIMAISRDPELFSSAKGMTVGEVNPQLLELSGR
jgi:methyl-branched lipid omega-hydroxylase